MRATSRLAAIVAVGGILALAAGCAKRAERPPEAGEIPGVTPAPGGLKFSVSIRPPRFALGQRVYMEASMFNESDRDFRRSYPNGCTWSYEVLAEDGRWIGPVQTCVDSARTDIHLAPGELRMIVREWKGRDRYFDAQAPLGPGRYQIAVGLVDRDMRVIPMAEPVWIEILERSR
jgi:hypothetical protein